MGPDSADDIDATLADERGPVVPMRPLRATVLSMVWPGLGHWATGQRRTGLVVAITTGIVVASASLWVATRTRAELVALATEPPALRAVMAVALATMAVRFVIVFGAVRSSGSPSVRLSRCTVLAIAVVLVVGAVPHIVVVAYAQAQLETVTTVFAESEAITARPSVLPAQDSPGVETSTGPSNVTTAETETEPAAPADSPPWGHEERLNVAVLGSDGGFDRTGVRTDTIMVVSVEVATGDAVVFSIPRNWERLPFPDGTPAAAAYPHGYDDIANAVYGLGSRSPSLFPNSSDPPGDAIKQALAQLLGIPVHYYVLVDMHAVVDVVDHFGGLDIWVDEYIRDEIKPIDPGGESLTIDVAPGQHRFDGRTTLAYVRSRRQSSDYNRMSRQRCILGAVVDQVAVSDVLLRYPTLTDIINAHVTTDIPIDDIPDLLAIAERMDIGRTHSTAFIPPDFRDGPAPVARVREEVERALSDSNPEGGATELATICGP